MSSDSSAARSDRLPFARLAHYDRLAVRAVVAELHRQPFRAGAELRPVLQMDVQVRLAGVAAVAAASEEIAGFDAVARVHGHRAAAEMREKRVLAVAVVDDDV